MEINAMKPSAQKLSAHQIPRRHALLAIGSACLGLIWSTKPASAQTDVTIAVELPNDRTRTGLLALKDKNGKLIAGPFRVLGKGDGRAARDNHNPTRNHILPDRK